MIDMMQAIEERHSVRSFTDEPLDDVAIATLEEEVACGNANGSLSMALLCDEPEAFDSTLAHYGKFANVKNYLVLAGPDAPDLAERCGYYGEKLVLLAQRLELNTCWVALTFKKRHVRKLIAPGHKLALVIALGHGSSQGSAHKVKGAAEVCSVPIGSTVPEWFRKGIDSALLAPTAMNQQKFQIDLTNDMDEQGLPLVDIRSKGGAYSDVDLGIVRLHFELGAGLDTFAWKHDPTK